MSSDIICIHEVHMQIPKINDQFQNFNNFNAYHIHGLMTQANKKLFISKIKQYNTKNIEYIIIVTLIKINELNICNLYARPNVAIQEYATIVQQVTAYVKPMSNLYIVGDFNIDMSTRNTRKENLEKYMQDHNMIYIIDKTHNVYNPSIDHIWTNSSNISYFYKVEAYWTNHLATFTRFHTPL